MITRWSNLETRLYQNVLRLDTLISMGQGSSVGKLGFISPIGSYKDGDIIIPDEALALYVIVEPEDTIRAMSRLL